MTERDIYDALHAIFRDVFDDPELTIGPETTAADIPEWDSFNHVNLIVATEIRFGIKFRTAEIGALGNVGDFVALIQEKLGQGGRSSPPPP